MRYVILIVGAAFFLIWDGLYNNGTYLDALVRGVAGLMRSIGL